MEARIWRLKNHDISRFFYNISYHFTFCTVKNTIFDESKCKKITAIHCKLRTVVRCSNYTVKHCKIRRNFLQCRAKVITPIGETGPFNISAGVLQGDTLAPYLFMIVLNYALSKAGNRWQRGRTWLPVCQKTKQTNWTKGTDRSWFCWRYRPPVRGNTTITRTVLPYGNLCSKSWAQDEQWQDQ